MLDCDVIHSKHSSAVVQNITIPPIWQQCRMHCAKFVSIKLCKSKLSAVTYKSRDVNEESLNKFKSPINDASWDTIYNTTDVNDV